MAYSITPEQAASIDDIELAFSTQKLLPDIKDIPKSFLDGNEYTRLAEAIFYGNQLPQLDMVIAEGFTAEQVNRIVRAHLQSWGPKHEHKIAGVGYMISCMATLNPIEQDQPSMDQLESTEPSSKTATPLKIEVQTTTGPVLINLDDSMIVGPFVIHRTIGDRASWTLTHVATGHSVMSRLPSEEFAYTVAKRIESLVDWSKATTTGFPEDTVTRTEQERLKKTLDELRQEAQLRPRHW